MGLETLYFCDLVRAKCFVLTSFSFKRFNTKSSYMSEYELSSSYWWLWVWLSNRPTDYFVSSLRGRTEQIDVYHLCLLCTLNSIRCLDSCYTGYPTKGWTKGIHSFFILCCFLNQAWTNYFDFMWHVLAWLLKGTTVHPYTMMRIRKSVIEE